MEIEPINSAYFFIMLIACSIAILLYRYTITLSRFLKSFIKISKKVSNKEFHSRLETSAKGELGELARNFNFMMETMENTIEEVEYKHLQLTSVLKSISHGILVIDIDGNIILINDEARKMIKSKCIGSEEGKNIKQVIAIDEILKGIKNNHVDFGFISDIKDLDKYNNLEAILVKKEEYVLIVPKNHPLANKEEVYLSDLKNEYFIAYNNKSSDVEKSYSDLIGYTPKIYAEPSESSILSGLVAAGAGIAIILNTPLINTNKISVIKIKDKIDDKSIYMVWNKNIIHNKNKMEFKNYALNMSKR